MKKQFIVTGFVLAFILTIVVNKINTEKNVKQLSRTSSEIFDDRLLPESYIYQLTELFYKKKLLLNQIQDTATHEKEFLKQTLEIIHLAEKYAVTRLTEKEKSALQNLAQNIGLLQQAENVRFRKGNNSGEIERICDHSLLQIELLSSIQVAEGKRLKESGAKITSSSEISGQLEWALYFILLLLFFSFIQKGNTFNETSKDYQLN
ncbi:MAG: hypothetical protein JNL60_06275 [Bacteroidia bacterium]|nr:hypothetical protein [Bacteroidia bacterium]